jgi:hypothetical protein
VRSNPILLRGSYNLSLAILISKFQPLHSSS